MTQATINALKAVFERQGAFNTIVADKFTDDPQMATEAENLVQLCDDATDALNNEPVE